MKIVGAMKFAPFIFYGMTLREAKLAIKGYREELHEQYLLNLYANTNAIGSCFGGKNYKSIDPFESSNNSEDNSNQMTADYVSRLRAFGIDARDVNETEFKENWKELSMDERRNLLFKK